MWGRSTWVVYLLEHADIPAHVDDGREIAEELGGKLYPGVRHTIFGAFSGMQWV